jgi:hypothetical protein
MSHSHPCFKRLFQQLSNASSRDERVRILHSARQSAHAEFPQQLARLEKLLLQFNPFTILATFAFYDLTYLPDVGRRMNESGDIEQYHIEIIQALILCHKEEEFQKRAFDPVEFQELRDLTSYVAYLHSARDLPDLRDGVPKEEAAQLHLRSLLRAHTKAVRNWGYEEQTIRNLKLLYEPLDDAIERELGVRVCFLIDAIRAELQSVGERLQEHFTKVKSFMRQSTGDGIARAYLAAFPDAAISVDAVNKLANEEGWTLDNVRLMLMHRSNSFLLTVFAFEFAELVAFYRKAGGKQDVHCVVSSWAMELGELHASNREHLFLANPIWSRPMLRPTPHILFWPIPSLFYGFCFDVIEALVCKVPVLKDKFLRRRADFLEQNTLQLFQKKFPDAAFFRGSKWENPSTGEKGENDLLVAFDSMALIIEEKSGSINAIARRGGPSIKQEIEQLITQAAEQAHAFARLLQNGPRAHRFQTTRGIVNRVDASKIDQLYCLSVTLERFGPLATQIRELQAAGLARKVQLVPTMSLSDLEILLELFQTPFELLHYLTRRAAFELHRKFLGDELDLLVFYLRTGFAEKKLPDNNYPLLINGLGTELDRFFINWPGDSRFERPRRSLSEWWKQILVVIEEKRLRHRYEVGCLLLDMPDEEQHAFESEFRQLCRKAQGRALTMENVEGISNHIKSGISNAVVVAIPVTQRIYVHRKFIVETFARRSMHDTGANRAVIILGDVELNQWPYVGMYLLEEDDLSENAQEA